MADQWIRVHHDSSMEADCHKKINQNRMTKQLLRKICLETSGYGTPYLNTCLYLHHRGFVKIESLEEYSGLQSLWLNGNMLDKIENLEMLSNMRCLQLHENCFKKLEGLDYLHDLRTLNLSNNFIDKIENISHLNNLSTLNISHNRLKDITDIEHLVHCVSLSVVDISHNALHDVRVDVIFAKMENLRVLNLMGNPVTKNMKNYRKVMISNIKNLCYLDDRPVTERERSCVTAWAEGGLVAEQNENKRWLKNEQEKRNGWVNALLQLRSKAASSTTEEKSDTKEISTNESSTPDDIPPLVGTEISKITEKILILDDDATSQEMSTQDGSTSKQISVKDVLTLKEIHTDGESNDLRDACSAIEEPDESYYEKAENPTTHESIILEIIDEDNESPI